MGRICPILNHPLKDGVLVEDEAIVKFIQKRNLDFLPNELVCRWCKGEVTKLYNKTLKKAIELHKSRLHDSSVSSLKTSKSSSKSSTTSEPLSHHRSPLQNGVSNGANSSNSNAFHQQNASRTNIFVQNNSNANARELIHIPTAEVISVSNIPVVLSTSISNTHSILQENQNNQEKNKTLPEIFGKQPFVTIRKKTIKDYLTIKAPTQKNTSQVTTTHTTAADESDDFRRLSQEPTTSNAVNTKKRRFAAIVDSDDDNDDPRNLNAVSGNRLPHIQPMPPKRVPKPDDSRTLAQDIMNEYIKDITGG